MDRSDSPDGADASKVSVSLARGLTIAEYGFEYGVGRPHYLWPAEGSDAHRSALTHLMFTQGAGGNMHLAPIMPAASQPFNDHIKPKRPEEWRVADPNRPQILDVGAGDGYWVTEMAGKYPGADICGVDQFYTGGPGSIPRNVGFVEVQVEHPQQWADRLHKSWDLIHLRALNGSVETSYWPHLWRTIFDHTKPGGWVEQVELDWTIRMQPHGNPDRQQDLFRWSEMLQRCMDVHGYSIRLQDTPSHLRKAGFIDVTEHVMPLPIGLWDKDREDLGMSVSFVLSNAAAPLAMKPLTKYANMTPDEVRILARQAADQSAELTGPAYMQMTVWTARRPPT